MEYLVFALGAILAFISLYLFVKGVGGNTPAALTLPGGYGFNIASSLVGLVLGCGLVYAALKNRPQPAPAEPGRAQTAANATAATPGPTPPAESASPRDRQGRVSLEIVPPGGGVIRRDDPSTDMRRDGGAWHYRVSGTSEGLTGEPVKVYLLYREIGGQHSWYSQPGVEVTANGEWTAESWVDDVKFDSPRGNRSFDPNKEWVFELMAVASSEELENGSRINSSLSKIRPPGSSAATDAKNPGKDFKPKAMSRSLLLRMPNPR